MAPARSPKNGFAALAGALSAIQDLLVPELKQHTELLRQHGGALVGIASVLREDGQTLHEHSEIMRLQGERLARIEGELVGVRNELHEHALILHEHSQILRGHGESLIGLRGEGDRAAG
jgi:hypothetical protein